MRVVKTFNNKWNFEFEVSRPQRIEPSSLPVLGRRLRGEEGAAEDEKKRFAVAGGVVEQARVVLDLFKEILSQGGGADFEVPDWVTNLNGKQSSFFSDLMHCVINGRGDLPHMIACPMKFASAGFDVFSSIS
mmetsp:Transcript_71329/g.204664  ORF Transcript_71329/g.204664 Transcript_71329/m.204664 type:complete len:132 (+) Transcript_71329:867-1262(+)